MSQRGKQSIKWGHLHDCQGRFCTRLASGWAPVAIWSRLESEVWLQYRSKRVICLFAILPRHSSVFQTLTSISLKTRHLSLCYTSTPQLCVPDNRWRNNGMRAAFSPTPEPYSQLSFRKSLYPRTAWFRNSLQAIIGLTSDFAVLPLSCVEIFCLWLKFLNMVCNKHYVRDIRPEKRCSGTLFSSVVFLSRKRNEQIIVLFSGWKNHKAAYSASLCSALSGILWNR